MLSPPAENDSNRGGRGNHQSKGDDLTELITEDEFVVTELESEDVLLRPLAIQNDPIINVGFQTHFN